MLNVASCALDVPALASEADAATTVTTIVFAILRIVPPSLATDRIPGILFLNMGNFATAIMKRVQEFPEPPCAAMSSCMLPCT
jgi:hypothetical protein